MIIDFHTHIFPDKIAEGAIASLKENANKGKYNVINHTDGTLTGLINSMEEKGVDMSIVLPVATSPHQTESINNFAETVRNEKVVSFGGIHPLNENTEEILEDLKKRGFKGIKLHPEYQQCDIDSPESIRILKKAEELEMYTVLHAGIDVGIEPPLHCSPKQLKNALNYVSGKYIIASHMGGFDMFDEVEKYLVGTNVYFDTSAIMRMIKKEQFKRILKNHGSEKILFATDSPWGDAKEYAEILKGFDLTKEEYDNITHKNALNILK
ncbi:MAG: amidohydrolase family protein [Clostridia bacterium]|nr:amidohydrolase family protein [Clostridia bacterium]